MNQPATTFLDYIESIFQKEARFYSSDTEADEHSKSSVMVFDDIPKQGYSTCVTYGLSYAQHEKWVNNRRPELIMSVNSTDPAWALALVDVVSECKGKFPFSYGQTISLGRPIVEKSNMTGFLFFAPAILGRETFMDIDLGLDYKVCLTGAYPVSDKEIKTIGQIGLEKFWKSADFDFLNVSR